MNCMQTRELIGPQLDGELDLMASLELKRHVECCLACAQVQERLQAVRSAVTASAPYYQAPEQFGDQIRAALRREIPHAPAPRRPWRTFLRPLAVAAAVLLVAGLALDMALHSYRSSSHTLAREVVAAHVRSLMADHLLDVRSSNQHTVKPWFNGKIDFAPEVRDLADAGFPLEGGRLDYLDGHAVAALVYRHNLHVINCFVWPARDAEPAVASGAQGYTLVRFTDRGLTWCIISDAAPATLEEFTRALHANAATTVPAKTPN
ncbi:MAG: putative transrane anti-sigma factor [Phycisphaerales bacterium]|nr:putative transrane anti-sigma factor [Phycisphaerales bacterium]